MKVYIVNNEYNTECESESSIRGVYDSMEKAQDVISDLYHDDCDWLRECASDDDVEFDEDTREKEYTHVRYDCYWSTNWIEEFDVK